MAKTTAAWWPAYDDVGELLNQLELTDEDMALARETTDDHIRAWHLAQVRTEQDRTQQEIADTMGSASLEYPRSSGESLTTSPSPPCAPTSARSAAAYASLQTSETASTT